MELDDSFTEKLLQRCKERREYINVKMSENQTIVGKKRSLVEEQSLAIEANNEHEESPKRQCQQSPFENSSSEDENEKENISVAESDTEASFVPIRTTGSKARGLAALKKNGSNIAVQKSESEVTLDDIDTSVDPAELPLSARKALFENALLAGTPRINEKSFNHKLSVAQRTAMFENAAKVNSNSKPHVNYRIQKRFIPNSSSSCEKIPEASLVNSRSPVKATSSDQANNPKTISIGKSESPLKTIATIPAQSTPSPRKNAGTHTRLVQQQLIDNASCHWKHKETTAKETTDRKQELSNLVSHWEKLSSSSSAQSGNEEEKISYGSDVGPLEYESGEESSCNEEDERENGLLCNDKDEATEHLDTVDMHDIQPPPVFAELNEDNSEVSLMSSVPPILEIVTNNVEQNWKKEGSKKSSSNSEDSFYSASKGQSCSSSSSFGPDEFVDSHKETGEVPTGNATSNNPDAPLLYTVSFYRKQKQEIRTPPMRTVVRQEHVLSSSSESDQTEIIQERIQALQQEILRQQTVISQTSQALNLCMATAEFSGSTEQVEGERLLLIATQKRQACLNEIQRLKSHGAQGENISDGTGTLTITDIQLPLKREFMATQLEGKMNDVVHYFLCLIRYGPQVIVTQMVSTDDKVRDGALCFTNHIKLQNLSPDFSVVFEVYGLQSKKEVLPHEKKYHIKKEHSKIRLTPKGKRTDGKILLPAVSSPGGPSAVRSPSFGVIGFTRFTIQNWRKRGFTLDKVPFSSPLDGVLRVKLDLHAEHKVMAKGFLTMFEDVSGFGAWHRRWCSLNAQHLIYWKYPDDEQKKEHIGELDLKQCVTGQVSPVSRDICARPHTFQLVTVRPQEKGDKNTLISRTVNTLTTTNHLLSADTKEERILWINKFNEALTHIRKWDPQALRPVQQTAM